MAISKKIRLQVKNKCGGKCGYCGCELDDTFQVDHMVSRQYWYMIDMDNRKSVDNIDNLMPTCRICNHYKRAHCLEDFYSHVGFRTYMLNFHKRLAKLPKKTKVTRTEKRIEYLNIIAEKYGISVDKPFSGVFYFETIKPCIDKRN